MKYLILIVVFLNTMVSHAGLPVSPNTADSLVKLGFTEFRIPQKGDTLAFNDQDKKQGFALYSRDRNIEIFPYSYPYKGERLDTLRLRAAPGEIESNGFNIYALSDLKKVKAEAAVKPLDGKSAWLAKAATVDDIVFHVIRSTSMEKNEKSFMHYPMFVYGPESRAIKKGATGLFWVTIKVPENVKAGAYHAAVSCSVDGTPYSFPLRVEVLPFRLTDKGLPCFGAFRSNVEFVSEEWEFLKETGIDMLWWIWPANRIQVINDNGKLKMDFTSVDAFVERMKKAGMRGPIAIQLGNNCWGSLEIALNKTFGTRLFEGELNSANVIVGDTSDPTLGELYPQACSLMYSHSIEKKWPRLTLVIYDEAPLRLMPWLRYWYPRVKKKAPDLPIYGVFHIADDDKYAQIPYCDIMCANRGHATTSMLAKKNDKEYWAYHNCDANRSFGKVRFSYGQIPSYYDATGMFFWSYNFYRGDPWNDFDRDGGDADWVIVYPSQDGKRPVQTLAFKGLIEGIDDVRYIKTLEDLVKEKDPGRWERLNAHIKSKQNKMFEGIILDHRVFTDEDFFRNTKPTDTENLRDFVIKEILNYSK